jgi:hypothetical protein
LIGPGHSMKNTLIPPDSNIARALLRPAGSECVSLIAKTTFPMMIVP